MSWASEIVSRKRASREMAVFEYARSRPKMRYKPRTISNLSDFGAEVGNVLGDRAHLFSDYKSRRFFTFGSCFANNIVAYLTSIGANAKTSMMTEDVNSPFNNRIFLRRILLGEKHPITDELSQFVDFDSMREDLNSATDVIVTLGNIFRLTLNDRPILKFVPGAFLEEESLEESVEYLTEMAGLLNGRLYATVSPIPISGYMGASYGSVMEADCASKSQLRTAIRRVPKFTYLPVFEIFRWLSAHQAFPTFGGDDGHQRHITMSQLGVVMGALC